MSEHRLDASTTHAFFDRDVPPRLEIDSGDTLTFELREALDGQITPETTVDDLAEIDLSRIHSLVGPVAIRGAEPGDTLEVELLEFEHHGWGWMGLLPGDGVAGRRVRHRAPAALAHRRRACTRAPGTRCAAWSTGWSRTPG